MTARARARARVVCVARVKRGDASTSAFEVAIRPERPVILLRLHGCGDSLSVQGAARGERLLARDGCGWRLAMGGPYLEEEECADY